MRLRRTSLGLVAALALAGCGGSSGSSSTTATGPATGGTGSTSAQAQAFPLNVVPVTFAVGPPSGGGKPQLHFKIHSAKPATATIVVANRAGPDTSESRSVALSAGDTAITWPGYIATGTSNVSITVTATAADGSQSQTTYHVPLR